MAVLYAAGTYFAAGLIVALAFISYGISRVVVEPRPATVGARILLIPASILLWPYVLLRWIRGRPRT
jgi:hypothetical protein